MGPTHNDQTGRTYGAIALYPSRNTSKGWWFMPILTGKVIHRSSWTKLPIPKEAIESIHAIASDQKQPLIGHSFKFERLPGDLILDDTSTLTTDDNYNVPDATHSPPQSIDDVIFPDAQIEDTSHHVNLPAMPQGADIINENQEVHPHIKNQGAHVDVHQHEETHGNEGAIIHANEGAALNANEGAVSNANVEARMPPAEPDVIPVPNNTKQPIQLHDIPSHNLAHESHNNDILREIVLDADNVRASHEQLNHNTEIHTYDEGDTIIVPTIDPTDSESAPVNHTIESIHEERHISPITNTDHSMHDKTMDIEDSTPDQHKKRTRSQPTRGTTAATPITKRLRKKQPINYRFLHQGGRTAQQFSQRVQHFKRKIKKRFRLKVNDMFRKTIGIIMANIKAAQKHDQVSVEEGIKRYGELAVKAVLSEYAQLDDRKIFKPVHVKNITNAQRKGALKLITMIKEKRCGKIKGRACADGRKQRRFIKKEDATSPTLQLESLLLSLLTDAFEGRNVATGDVTGAFLLADMDGFVLVRITGEAVDIMCDVNNDYKAYVTMEKGKKVLYMQLVKALYGCVRSAILWYETFCECLEQLGFKLNRYDPCVANKMFNGEQCTICWYVDDCKISHKDPNVVTWVIYNIEKRFGEGSMAATRGNKHTFVGMDFELTNNRKVKISMEEYIRECIESFQEIEPLSETRENAPSKNDLFEIDDNSAPLDDAKTEMFHHIVSKLLYVSKRARLDIDLTISFLCTRVSRSTQLHWGKLRRLLVYLQNTIGMVRIIGAHSLDVIKIWVDASYGVHHDFRGHIGGIMSMEKGVFHSKSGKQTLNTKSSTETEVVGASDYLPWTIWDIRFMEDQGYPMRIKIFYQDNESALKLESNGRKSCGDKSRHIHIRYFFIKDVLRRENIELKHCRTENMTVDFFTKPLQGSLFNKMRNVIMGYSEFPAEEPDENNIQENVKATENIRHNSIRKNFTFADAVRNTDHKS